MKKGIVLIAVGHPEFGKMAYNLALTIKAAGDIPIAVIHDDNVLAHLEPVHKQVFDQFIKAPDVTSDMDGAMKLRLMLPKLTPFQETLSLDVDMAWTGPDPNEVFDLLAERDITYVNEGYYDLDNGEDHTNPAYIGWATPDVIKEAYELKGKLFQMRGEFILFRKTKEVAKIFGLAKNIQKSPRIDTIKLGGAVTEEFALNIAANQMGVEPHESGWQATYWPMMNGNLLPTIPELKANYYGLSVGGNVIPYNVLRAYGILVDAAAYKLGLPTFKLKAKRNFLPARIDV